MDANGYENFDHGCHGELFTFSSQYYFENLRRLPEKNKAVDSGSRSLVASQVTKL